MYVTTDCDIMKYIILYFSVESENGHRNAHSNQDMINSYSGNGDSHIYKQ
jgi:hypothetical protein